MASQGNFAAYRRWMMIAMQNEPLQNPIRAVGESLVVDFALHFFV
jgi:hypothetical protein